MDRTQGRNAYRRQIIAEFDALFPQQLFRGWPQHGNTDWTLRITDDTLERIGSLKKLKKLYLHDTLITDAGLERLTELEHLEYLDVGWNNRITDEGLRHMSAFPRLTGVNLFATQITDAGLEHLVRIATLEYIQLKKPSLSDETINRLREALPRAD